MTRIVLATALALSMFSGAAMAQQATVEQPRKARSCTDVKNDPGAPRALIALCAWVGQYR